MNATTQAESLVLDLEPQQSAQLPALLQTGALSVNSPAGIMLAAMNRGASAADVREMLALQREWRADEARNSFNKAMAGFKAEPIYLAKSKSVGYETADGGFVGYKHAELADVVAAVGPALARHGLSHRWDVKQAKDWITVTCVLKHADGHSETVEMGGPPDNSGKKNPIQQIASTTRYLQRYTLEAITGVAEGGEDDDGRGGAVEPSMQAGAQGSQAAEVATYPAEGFAKNLPAWRKLIADGKKTADQIIATVQSKAPLSEVQKAAIRGGSAEGGQQ